MPHRLRKFVLFKTSPITSIFRYRQQCESLVEVSCSLLEWAGSCTSMVERIATIIEAQCAQCTGNGVCAEWYGYLSQLQGLSPDSGKYSGYGNKPMPYCTGKQCEDGTHNCDENASCTQSYGGQKLISSELV